VTDEELFRQCLQVMEGNSTPLMKPLVIELVKVRIGRSTLKQRQYSKQAEEKAVQFSSEYLQPVSPAEIRAMTNKPWEE
jgi:hypothetical protein